MQHGTPALRLMSSGGRAEQSRGLLILALRREQLCPHPQGVPNSKHVLQVGERRQTLVKQRVPRVETTLPDGGDRLIHVGEGQVPSLAELAPDRFALREDDVS